MSIENLIIELGISSQPFTIPYPRYNSRATTGFCTCLWEKLDKYKLKLQLGKNVIVPPRQHDQWLMTSFELAGYTMEDCKTLNMVRLHQQVIFDSDVYNADGNTINPRYLHPREAGQKWSTLRFGKQCPPPSAFNLWRDALDHLTPGGRRRQRLGEFTHHTHVIWQWRYDPRQDIIYHMTSQGVTQYNKHNSVRRARHSTYTLHGPVSTDISHTHLCSTNDAQLNTIVLQSHIKFTPQRKDFQHFLDVLKSWQYPRIWKSLKFTGDGSWLYEAIQTGSLTCVSDGSFLRELHPHICSAAIMFECSKSGGQLSLSFADRSLSANAS